MHAKPVFIVLSLTVLLWLSPASARLDAQTPSPTDFCWQTTYGRGVGEVPESCASGQERIGLLCYDQCPAGTKRAGLDCHSECPEGFRDDGLFCRMAEYGRGAGYPWKIGDPALNYDHARARCEQDHGAGNCEQDGLIWYPRCRPGYTAVGCCICRPAAPNCAALGLNAGIDLSCAKRVTVGAPFIGTCGSGQELDAGLCYKTCDPGDDGVGPVCWGACPDGWVKCGMGCAKDQPTCTMAITDQVVSVVDSVASIALLVGSMGASAAGKSLLSKGAWQGVKKIGKAAAKDVVKAVAVASLVQLPGDVTRAASGTIDWIWQVGDIETSEMTDVERQHAIASIALQNASLLDPTGILGVVAAYTKPVCKDIAAAQTGTSQTATPASTSQAADQTGAAQTGALAIVRQQHVRLATMGVGMATESLTAANASVRQLESALGATQDRRLRSSLQAQLNAAKLVQRQAQTDLQQRRAMLELARQWEAGTRSSR